MGVFTGLIKGVKYKITAEAWLDPDVCMPAPPKSYTFKVYKPIALYRKGTNTGAGGHVEISRFYYDGSYIIMDAFIRARNPINNPEANDPDKNPLSVLPWFWTQKYPAPDGAPEDERRDTKPRETIQVGESSQYYYPGPLTDPEPGLGGGQPFDRWVGTIKEGEPLYYKAHAHLQVSDGRNPTDNWEVDTQQQTDTAAVTFTWKDGP